MWTIHDNGTILITLKATHIRAILCYMSLFLALETEIIFVRHYIDCERWNNDGCELLYSIKLLNFGDCISECLWSFLIEVDNQTMSILQSFDEDSDGVCIICKITSLSFLFESGDVCCRGFLFSLRNPHEA